MSSVYESILYQKPYYFLQGFKETRQTKLSDHEVPVKNDIVVKKTISLKNVDEPILSYTRVFYIKNPIISYKDFKKAAT